MARKRERRRLKKLRRKRRDSTARSTRLKRRKTRLLERYAELAGLGDQTGGAHRQLVRFPKVFSFIENPDAAIAVINSLVNAVRRPAAQQVELDQSDCRVIDYGAEALSTAIALEAYRHFQLKFRGNFPEEEELKKVILAAGVPHYLGVELPEVPEIDRFPLVRGRARAESAKQSSERDRVTSRFTVYIDRCLGHYGFGLTREGKSNLSSLVSEVIGNAEEHSGTANWWVAGYLQQGDAYGDCHISIFNFGETLAESLQRLPKEAQLRRRIEKLVERHQSKGFFGLGSWEPDRLWALYALQQGVSRFNDDAYAVGDRGQGTVQLIRFFQFLGKTKAAQAPRMSIVSGNTQFLFDGTYEMKPQEEGERSIIAFNEANTLEEPPDANNVRRINSYFPGTMISLRFYFDEEYLKRIGGNSNGSD